MNKRNIDFVEMAGENCAGMISLVERMG